ncbi:MAG: polyprenol monophosphomannose synthase [Chloroflexota bacterium]|jgi:dolichol-phosphate mannosyltransferase
MKIIAVVPTYNEAENLPILSERLLSLPIPDLSLLIVDDNSPDGSGEIAEQLASASNGRMFVLHRSGKLGLGSAYIQGFERALNLGAEAVCQMDADFSHPPEKIIELAAALQPCDVAIGSRYAPGGSLDERWPFWRKGLSAFGNLYARAILSIPVRDVTGGFRLWRRETLKRLPLERVRSNGYIFQVEMIYIAHLLGFRSREIPIHFADRRWGQSKMSLRIQIEAAYRTWMLLWQYRDLRQKRAVA